MALMLETPPRAAALPVQNLVDSLSRSGKAKHAPTEFNEELMAQRVSLSLRAPPPHPVFATVLAWLWVPNCSSKSLLCTVPPGRRC